MSKSVLLSIKPKYCELIASGKKAIEVRKTKPKLDTPFKCYIYCTQDFANFATKTKRSEMWIGEPLNSVSKGHYLGNGKVIGEFVCDTIITDRTFGHDPMFKALSCMNDAEIASYCTANEMYGFHISDLAIYDQPRELSDFRKPCIYGEESDVSCFLCDKSGYRPDMHIDCFNEVTRPPQSWGYVEELK